MSTFEYDSLAVVTNSTASLKKPVDARQFFNASNPVGAFTKVRAEWLSGTNTDFSISAGKILTLNSTSAPGTSATFTNINTNYTSANTIGTAGNTTFYGDGSNLTGIAVSSGGVGLPAIEEMAELQKIKGSVTSSSIRDAFINGFVIPSTNNYEIGANGQINIATKLFGFDGTTGTSTYIIDRLFLSKAVANGTLKVSVNIDNSDTYDVKTVSSTVQTLLESSVDYASNLPNGTTGWFVKMIRTDLGSSTYTKWVQADAGQYTTISSTSWTNPDLSVTHSAVTGLTNKSDTVKYIFIFDNSALDYSITSATATESFVSVAPASITVQPEKSETIFTDNFNRADTTNIPGNNWTRSNVSFFSDSSTETHNLFGIGSNKLIYSVWQQGGTTQIREIASRNLETYNNAKLPLRFKFKASYTTQATGSVDIAVRTSAGAINNHTAGVGAEFQLKAGQVLIVNEGTTLDTTAYTFTAGVDYYIWMEVTLSEIKYKIATTNSEPTTWNKIQAYVNGSSGSYLLLDAYVANSNAGSTNNDLYIDDFSVEKVSAGSTVLYEKAIGAASLGDKLAIKVYNKRSLNTNLDKQIVKYAGII